MFLYSDKFIEVHTSLDGTFDAGVDLYSVLHVLNIFRQLLELLLHAFEAIVPVVKE